jgi:hypothetical protein
MARLSVVGVPDSAGSYAAGQDQAPAALRDAGLIAALVATGREVNDTGDLPEQRWKPDRAHPYAQNADKVATGLQALTDRLTPLFSAGDTTLVVGGNCTIALSVMDAFQRLGDAMPGLLYIDRHFDLNTPASTTDGALDWMGMAHGLSLPGCADVLADAFERRPLLRPDQVAWLGVDGALAINGSGSKQIAPPRHHAWRPRRRRRVGGERRPRDGSAIEGIPAQLVAKPLVVEHEFTDLDGELGALPAALETAGFHAFVVRRCRPHGLDRIRRRTEFMCRDMAYRRSLAGSVRGVSRCPTQVSGRRVRVAGCSAGHRPRDVAPCPRTPEVDRSTWPVVIRPHLLEMVQHVVRAVSRPAGETMMIVVSENATAAHCDEPRIANLREDHGFLHVAPSRPSVASESMSGGHRLHRH